jgi:hypothetical protein
MARAAGLDSSIARIFVPKLARPLDLAMIASAGFAIFVVPVMGSAEGFAVSPFFEEAAKRSRQQDAEISSPAIWLIPLESRVENHSCSWQGGGA